MRRCLVVLCLLFATSCFAVWQKLGQLNTPIGCCFFLDNQNGFIGSGSYGSSPAALKIWVTRNGGQSWIQCATPSEVGQVTQISIDTSGVGYASIFCMTNPSMNLWKTTDGGFTWFDASTGQQYGTGAGIKGGTFRATAWNTSGAGNNGVFFMEDKTLFISPGPGATNANEAWSAYGDATTKIWYQVKELARRLYISTDQGATWNSKFIFNQQPTGHISGLGGTIYIQTQATGMWRSTDSGGTWVGVGGPSNYVDTRSFAVMGCSGREVIAFDINGGVWKTNDGGDGLLGTANPISIKHISIPQISACAVAQGIATLTYSDCGELIITGATVENDPNGVFTLQPFTVPDTLRAGDTVRFIVDFDPKGNPLSYNARIRIKQKEIRGGILTPMGDSLIRINAIAAGVPPKLTSSLLQVQFPERSVCAGSADTVITLRNEGCDTLVITNGPTSTALPFTVGQLPSPFILPPDSTVTFTITFKPDAAGSFSASTQVQSTSQGKQQEIQILIDGKGLAGEGILSLPKASFVFPTISICSGDSLKGYFANIGCDTLVVDSAVFKGDADFSIVTASLAAGYKLRPGDTIWFTIDLAPIQKGTRTGSFDFVLHNEHGSFPSSVGQVTFSANITDGTRSITQSLADIDFGTTDLCSERDSLFTLRNTGCDTITITAATLAGSGFVLPGVNLPIVLPPGSTRDIVVATIIDTAAGKTASTASISFVSNASNSITPIQLRRAYIFPKIFDVSLNLQQHAGTSGEFVHLAVIGGGGLGSAGSGIHTLDLTIDLNDDLLEFVKDVGPNTVTKNGSRVTITNTPELVSSNGAVADLVYQIYLTKDSTTDVVLSNVVINGGDTSACASRILGGGSLGNGEPAFTYTFRCGDHTIQDALQTPVNIISIRPNPAADEVVLEVDSKESIYSSVEIYNASGIRVLSLGREIHMGQAEIRLDISHLAEGQYTVQLIGAGARASALFVKQ